MSYGFWIDAIAADGLVKAVPEADTQLIANATAVDITRTPGRGMRVTTSRSCMAWASLRM